MIVPWMQKRKLQIVMNYNFLLKGKMRISLILVLILFFIGF